MTSLPQSRHKGRTENAASVNQHELNIARAALKMLWVVGQDQLNRDLCDPSSISIWYAKSDRKDSKFEILKCFSFEKRKIKVNQMIKNYHISEDTKSLTKSNFIAMF